MGSYKLGIASLGLGRRGCLSGKWYRSVVSLYDSLSLAVYVSYGCILLHATDAKRHGFFSRPGEVVDLDLEAGKLCAETGVKKGGGEN